MGNWLSDHIDSILTLLGGGGMGYIFSHRKRKAETERMIQDNEQHVIAMYRETLDDMEARFKLQIEQLNEKIEALHKELEDCKKRAGF